MPPPEEKDVIFCSSPIYHELHKLTTYILKFKNQPHSKIKTDFLRAANALVTIQNGGDCDFLVLPQIPMNFQQRQIIGKQGSLLLIMAEDFSISNELKDAIDSAGLEVTQEEPPEIHPKLFSDALAFVAEHKMAPNWNRIQGYYVRHPDFLIRQNMEVVKTDFKVAEIIGKTDKCYYQIDLGLSGVVKKWDRLVSLQDLAIEPRYREMFIHNQIDDIPLQHLGIQYFHVLPKMTRGRLVSVSKHITPSEWIKTKDDMRKYWRTTYGYELPITFGGIFCNIRFGNANMQNSFEVFCYPIECIRLTEPHDIPRSSMAIGKELISKFLDDFQENVATVCHHHKIDFPKKPMYLPPTVPEKNRNTSKITDHFKVAKDGDHSGLVASSGDRSQKGSIGLENVKARVEQNQTGNGTQPDISAAVEPFRSRTYPDSGFESGFGLDFDKAQASVEKSLVNWDMLPRYTPRFSKKHYFNDSYDSEFNSSQTEHPRTFSEDRQNQVEKVISIFSQEPKSSVDMIYQQKKLSHAQETTQKIAPSSSTAQKPKIVPSFSQNTPAKIVKLQNLYPQNKPASKIVPSFPQNKPSASKIVPSFPKPKPKVGPSIQSKPKGNFLLQQQQKSKETFPTLSEMVPKFHSTPKPVNPTPSAFTPGPSNGIQSMPELPIRPPESFKFPLNFDTSTMNLQSIENVPNFQLQMLQNYQAPEIQPSNQKENKTPNVSKDMQLPNLVPNFAPNMPKFVPKKKIDPNFIAKQISLKNPVPPSMIPRPEPKKPRIQDYLDIPSLAADGLLHKKANVATLKTWLGSQGIVVKSKSKKEELVLMVLTKLGKSGAKSDDDGIFEP